MICSWRCPGTFTPPIAPLLFFPLRIRDQEEWFEGGSTEAHITSDQGGSLISLKANLKRKGRENRIGLVARPAGTLDVEMANIFVSKSRLWSAGTSSDSWRQTLSFSARRQVSISCTQVCTLTYQRPFIMHSQQINDFNYRQWTHVRIYGTDVIAVDMLSSIFQASWDKSMKPMAFGCVFILVLRRFLPDFKID